MTLPQSEISIRARKLLDEHGHNFSGAAGYEMGAELNGVIVIITDVNHAIMSVHLSDPCCGFGPFVYRENWDTHEVTLGDESLIEAAVQRLRTCQVLDDLASI